MSLVTFTSFELTANISTELLAFLPSEQIELIQDTLNLLRLHITVQKHRADNCPCEVCKNMPVFYDYAFIVFPIAKAYEGYLKYFFWKMRIISEQRYRSRQLRIGRSFNPDLPSKFRDEEWLFDDVVRFCSEESAMRAWEVWLNGRNHLFHYFPDDRYSLTLEEAKSGIREFLNVMETLIACKIARDGVLT